MLFRSVVRGRVHLGVLQHVSVAGDFRLRRIGGFRPDFFYRYLVRFYRRTKIGFALNILNKDGRNIRDVDCRFSDF